jgi:hypothetical protein
VTVDIGTTAECRTPTFGSEESDGADGVLTAEYSAPGAGPPPWDLYAVTPVTAFGLASSEPFGATRWRFQART